MGWVRLGLPRRTEDIMAERYIYQREVARSGVSVGSALAIAISWSKNGSILWAILHGIFSWFYVIYHALTR